MYTTALNNQTLSFWAADLLILGSKGTHREVAVDTGPTETFYTLCNHVQSVLILYYDLSLNDII